MNGEDLRSLARVLMYGTVETRRALAERLITEHRTELWQLLVETVRSDEPWLLRARCLEVLGLVAGNAEPETAGTILAGLLSCAESRAVQPA
jgi:hypothetical protein